MKIKQIISILLLYVLLALIAYSYHPRFFGIETEEASPISRYIFLSTALLVVSSVKIKSIFQSKFLKTYLVLLIIAVLIGLLVQALGVTTTYMSEFNYIIMAFSFCIIGYCINLSDKQNSLVLFSFAVFFAYIVYLKIISNLGGLIIADQYISGGKNQVGVILATVYAATFSSALIGLGKKNMLKFSIWALLSFALLVLTVTIRARTSMLGMGIVSVMALYSFDYLKRKDLFPTVAVFSFIAIVIFVAFDMSSAMDFVSDSFTQNREGDITSGRTSTYAEAIGIVVSNPFFGMMDTGIKISWVHNYLLRIISNYGLVGGMFFVALYLYIWYSVIRRVGDKRERSIVMTAPLCLLTVLFSSLAEPTFPYGPGTATFFAFFLFGQYLHFEQKNGSLKGSKPSKIKIGNK